MLYEDQVSSHSLFLVETESLKTVHVGFEPAPRGYDIIIGSGVLNEAGALIKKQLGERRCVIITDRQVATLYQQRLEAVLASAGHTLLSTIVVSPGEGSKSFETLQEVLDQLFVANVDRQTLVVALGGGVVGDLAGFAASLVLRGVDFVQVPTTMLAQVDSSVGGKTGINSSYGKNTVGAFYQPRMVLADVEALDSLSERELRAGYAEIVKYGLILDAPFFEWCVAHGDRLLHGDREAQVYAVTKSCEHKGRLVASDERELGARALLNLGHTFGHALEAFTGYGSKLLHGEAVAIGMAMSFCLSAEMGYCSESDAKAACNHLKAVGLPVALPSLPYDIDKLMMFMGQDKKARDGKLTLVLTRGIGQAFVAHDVNPSSIRSLWQSMVG